MRVKLLKLNESNDVVGDFINRHPTFTKSDSGDSVILSSYIGTGEILRIIKDGKTKRWSWAVYEPVILAAIEEGKSSFNEPEEALKNFVKVSGLVRRLNYGGIVSPNLFIPLDMVHRPPRPPKPEHGHGAPKPPKEPAPNQDSPSNPTPQPQKPPSEPSVAPQGVANNVAPTGTAITKESALQGARNADSVIEELNNVYDELKWSINEVKRSKTLDRYTVRHSLSVLDACKGEIEDLIVFVTDSLEQ